MWKGPAIITTLLLLAALLIGCDHDTMGGNDEGFVDFGELVAAPQRYHGRQICTAGAYALGFETSALGASTYRRGTAYYLVDPAIWVEGAQIRTTGHCFTADTVPATEFCRVEICGLFESGGNFGHLGGYQYQLRDVGR
jgi:hypothetical protein